MFIFSLFRIASELAFKERGTSDVTAYDFPGFIAFLAALVLIGKIWFVAFSAGRLRPT